MPFTVGQRVRCVNASGTLTFLTNERDYTVDYVSPLGTSIRVEGIQNDFRASRFEAVVQPPQEPRFRPGQTVLCINSRGVSIVSYGDQLIVREYDPETDRVIFNEGYWLSADRFTANLNQTAAPKTPKAVPYSIETPLHCCGAVFVYFRGSYLTDASVKATDARHKSHHGVPMMIGILNNGQFGGTAIGQENTGHEILVNNGWQKVGETASNSGPAVPLHLYMKAFKASNVQRQTVEAPRAFGA